MRHSVPVHSDKRSVVTVRTWGSRELALNGDRVSVWEDEKVLEVSDGRGCPEVVNAFHATEL